MNRRVLHAIRTTGMSGAENHLATLVAALPSVGWDADVLLAVPDRAAMPGLADRFRAAGAGVTTVPMPRDVSLRFAGALRRALGDYDLVHTHLVHADWHAGIASIGMRAPALISTKHNHDPFRSRQPFRAVEQLWLRRSAGAIAISTSLSDFVERHNRVRPETVLYGWPAGPSLPVRAAPVRRLLAVGRLERQKGLDVLLEAMAILMRKNVDVRLEVAGEGTQRQALQHAIERDGLGDRVTLLGQRTDVRALMEDADLLVHPARWEGFGLVLLEAMDASLPIIASDVGAIPEVVAETALLVAPDDPASLADAIERIVANPDTAAGLARAGHQRLRERFDPEVMAARTAEIYGRALARGSAR